MNAIPESAWVAYLALVVFGFGALEVPALMNRVEGDTLSERTRAWLFTDGSVWRRVLRIAFCVVTGGVPLWFLLHIVTGLV